MYRPISNSIRSLQEPRDPLKFSIYSDRRAKLLKWSAQHHAIKGSWGTTFSIVLEGLCSERKSASSTFYKVKGFHKTPLLISTKPKNGANIGFHTILSHLTVKIVFSSPLPHPTLSSPNDNPFPSIQSLETRLRGPLDQYLPSLN